MYNLTFGWVPDIPDQRDRKFSIVKDIPIKTNVDLRSVCPPIYDQGNLGSCTAQAIAGVIQFDQMKENLVEQFTPSQLFIYYNERVIEGTVNSDCGAMIRTGVKSVNKDGVCPNKEWAYIISKFKTTPPVKAYNHAKLHPTVEYSRINNVSALGLDMLTCLSDGYPFIFGFSVYESFMNIGKSGIVKMPKPTERVLGGHAVVAVGYNWTNKTISGCPSNYFIVRNSWGTSWGKSGYFFMPKEYLTDTNLADDFWVIRVVK
jgi:C1A family cysteine protease